MRAFKEAYKGFEIIFNSFKMSSKMFLYVFISLFLIYVCINIGITYARLFKTNDYFSLKYYYKAKGADSMALGKEANVVIEEYNTTLDAKTLIAKLEPNVSEIWSSIGKQFGYTALIFLLFPIAIIPFARRTNETLNANYIRGTKIVDEKKIKRDIEKDKLSHRVKIGNIPFPIPNEPKGIFMIGRPGAGKTVANAAIINGFKNSDGIAGIIYDYKGDYTERFFNPNTDYIFNPFDSRTIDWNMLTEVKFITDIDMLAKALIPEPHFKSDPYWNTAARDVFIAILRLCFINNQKTNKDIWSILRKPPNEIANLLKAEAACATGYKHICEPDSKQAMAVFAVMMQYARVFEYMQNTDGYFSISEWVKNPKGWIFINNHAEIKDALKPVLSLFVEVMLNKFSALSENYDRRIIVSLDELPTLHKIETLVHSMNVNRGRGIVHIAGVQDKSQLDEVYDQNLSNSIINACGNSIIFSVADPSTADYLSKKIGVVEVEEVEETQSMGVAKNRDGVSLMKRKREKAAVLPSEIINLRDLEIFIKMSNYDVVKTKLEYKKYESVNPAFLIKDNLRIENIREQFAQDEAEVVKKKKKASCASAKAADLVVDEYDEYAESRFFGEEPEVGGVIEVYSGLEKVNEEHWRF